jgi:hypothetical protein
MNTLGTPVCYPIFFYIWMNDIGDSVTYWSQCDVLETLWHVGDSVMYWRQCDMLETVWFIGECDISTIEVVFSVITTNTDIAFFPTWMLFSYLCLGPRSSQISIRRLGSTTNWWWLFQGLHSKDKRILQSVLMRNDPVLISNTVTRLSLQCTVPLIKELATLIQGKTVVWVDFPPFLHHSYWW